MQDGNQRAIEYQLECLKTEIEAIGDVLQRLESYSQSARNFAVLLWVGTVTVMIAQPELRKFLLFTCTIPALFWYIDARWIQYTKGPMIRLREISSFLNSSRLEQSLQQSRLIDFMVLDIMGVQYKSTLEYRRRTSLFHISQYPTLLLFYGTLFVLSIGLGLAILWF
jgi:hypothetical protein